MLAVGDKVKGTKRFFTSKLVKDARGKIVLSNSVIEIAGVVKTINPDIYFGVEVQNEDGESEWFHKSALTVIAKPF